jgi:hypothetical protein
MSDEPDHKAAPDPAEATKGPDAEAAEAEPAKAGAAEAEPAKEEPAEEPDAAEPGAERKDDPLASPAKSVPVAAPPKQDPREWVAAVVVMLVIGVMLFLVSQWFRG